MAYVGGIRTILKVESSTKFGHTLFRTLEFD